MRQIAIGLVLWSGCTLYFGDDGMPPGGDPPPPPPSSSKELAIPCIRTIARLPLAAADHDGLLVTSGCDGEGAVVANVQLSAGAGLHTVESYADWSYPFDRTIPAELTHSAPGDFLALVSPDAPADSPTAFAFFRYGHDQVRSGKELRFDRPIRDATAVDLDGDGNQDLLVAGDGALRFVMGTPSGLPDSVPASYEIELAHDGEYSYAVAAELGGPPGLDLLYVTESRLGEGIYTTVSVAMNAASAVPAPLAFAEPTVLTSFASSSGTVNDSPLVVGDVDGDGLSDVAGATPQTFVWTSQTQTVQMFGSHDLLAMGDIDGDGVQDLIVRDGDAIGRLHLDGTVEELFKGWGQLLALGDLDGDGRDDIALVHGAGLDDSSVVVYLSSALH